MPDRVLCIKQHFFKLKMQNHNLKFKIGLLVFGLLMFLFLSQVFSGRLILPQTFSFSFVSIHFYGLIMALSVLVGYFYATWSAPRFGFTKEQTENLILYIVPICFVSARLYHVLSEFGYYKNHLGEILQIWQGGMGIFGVMFGGAIGLIILNKTLNLKSSVLNLYDWLAPAVLLGQIIGRFGNLFNYEAYGYPTNLPWKMFVPENFRPIEYAGFSFFHPWFLYEVLGNVVIFLGILYFVRKRKVQNFSIDKAENSNFGALFFSYILWYNALRFVLEFLRIDSTFSGQYRLNAVISLALVILGLIGFLWSRRKSINVQVP